MESRHWQTFSFDTIIVLADCSFKTDYMEGYESPNIAGFRGIKP